jgi:hypothetical protein
VRVGASSSHLGNLPIGSSTFPAFDFIVGKVVLRLIF